MTTKKINPSATPPLRAETALIPRRSGCVSAVFQRKAHVDLRDPWYPPVTAGHQYWIPRLPVPFILHRVPSPSDKVHAPGYTLPPLQAQDTSLIDPGQSTLESWWKRYLRT